MDGPIQTHRPGFTMIELLVVISIIALLVAILLPVLGAVRESSKITLCQSNLRQIGIAGHAYATDHDDYPPTLEAAGGTPMRMGAGVDGMLNPRIASKRPAIETLGLPALYDQKGYMAYGNGWVCPVQYELTPATGSSDAFRMADWGNTYTTAVSPTDITAVNGRRIEDIMIKTPNIPWAQDNWRLWPGPAGEYAVATAGIPWELRNNLIPHRFGGPEITLATWNTYYSDLNQVGGSNQLFYDGRVLLQEDKTN